MINICHLKWSIEIDIATLHVITRKTEMSTILITADVGEDVEHQNHSFISCGNSKQWTHIGRQHNSFL